jgi:hypothetical protein
MGVYPYFGTMDLHDNRMPYGSVRGYYMVWKGNAGDQHQSIATAGATGALRSFPTAELQVIVGLALLLHLRILREAFAAYYRLKHPCFLNTGIIPRDEVDIFRPARLRALDGA